MNIKIYAIGKCKDFYKTGIDEYTKRLSSYCKLQIIELKDEPIPDKPSASQITKAKEIESGRVLALLKPNEYLVSLDLNQKEMDSVEFSEFLKRKLEDNGANISFVIGGSYGLSDVLKNRANASISFSKMTFPHQLMRVILLEQIYRAFRIINREPYHK